VTDGALRADRPRGADRVRSHELAIVLRTTGRRARQVWLGCKRCALSGTDHRDPRTEEGCPVTETRTGLPAAVSSGYPDRIAGGYFVRVPGRSSRRQFRSGYTMTVQRLARSRPNGGRARPQQSLWRGATLPRFQAARSRFKTTPSPRDVVNRALAAAAQQPAAAVAIRSTRLVSKSPEVKSTGVVTCTVEKPPLRPCEKVSGRGRPLFTTSLRAKSPERPKGGWDSQGKARSLVGPSLGSFDREAVERRGPGGFSPRIHQAGGLGTASPASPSASSNAVPPSASS
jgi:hypothetical protein